MKTPKKLIDRVLKENNLTESEIIKLLKLEGEELTYLWQKADEVREKYLGKKIYLRAIIEFSNICKRNCLYCGLRKDNKKVERYQMKVDDILEASLKAIKAGFRTVVLQSGEDNYPADKIAWVIEKIKKFDSSAAVTLSLGERDYEEYEYWRKKGADRYLLKHETTDKELYQTLHPDLNYSERIECMEMLFDLDYQVGSGNIIGLPGQNEEILAKDIGFFKKHNFHMLGIGPLIIHPETPLKNSFENENKEERTKELIDKTLKVMAISRLLIPLTHIPATTAIATLSKNGREQALKRGANVIMPDLTPKKFSERYEIYPGRKSAKNIEKLASSIGRKVSYSAGHSPMK